MTIFPKSATPVISVEIVMLSPLIASFTKYHVEYPTPNNDKIAKKVPQNQIAMISCTFSYKNSLKTERLLDYLTITAAKLTLMVLPFTASAISSYAVDLEGSFAYATVTSEVTEVTSEILKTSNAF